MTRVLEFLLVVALALYIARQLRALLAPPPPPPRDAGPREFEPMARCAQCGVHVPAGSLGTGGLCRECARR